MSELSITAKRRTVTSKGELSKFRREGAIPGVVYSKDHESIPIFIAEHDLRPLVYTSDTHIVELKVDDSEPVPAILKAVQFDPVTDKIIHFDLYGVTMGQKLELKVPVILTGQAKGVKEGGVVQHNLHKIDIECLPKNIPEHVTVDISDLEIGDSIHIGDLNIPDVEILHPERVIVVTVTVPKIVEPEEEEAEEGLEEATEPEVIGKGKSEEEGEEEKEDKEDK